MRLAPIALCLLAVSAASQAQTIIQTTPSPTMVLSVPNAYSPVTSQQQNAQAIGQAQANYLNQQSQSQTTFDPFRTPAFQPVKSPEAEAKDNAAAAAAAAAGLPASGAAATPAEAEAAAPAAAPRRNAASASFGSVASRAPAAHFESVETSALAVWGWNTPRMLEARRVLASSGLSERVVYFEAGRQSPEEFTDWVERHVAVAADPASR
jgi:hypothetical protein